MITKWRALSVNFKCAWIRLGATAYLIFLTSSTKEIALRLLKEFDKTQNSPWPKTALQRIIHSKVWPSIGQPAHGKSNWYMKKARKKDSCVLSKSPSRVSVSPNETMARTNAPKWAGGPTQRPEKVVLSISPMLESSSGSLQGLIASVPVSVQEREAWLGH